MAEEQVFVDSAGAESLKRKFEDEVPDGGFPTGEDNGGSGANTEFEDARRKAAELAARFSEDAEAKRVKLDDGPPTEEVAPAPAAAEADTTSVPAPAVPALSDFELAKKKAAELAAKFSEGAGDGSKFSSTPGDAATGSILGGGPASNARPAAPGQPSVFSPAMFMPGNAKSIEVPNAKVGLVIGKSGDTIKYLQQLSGARIQVTKDADTDPNSSVRTIELMGTEEQIKKAEQLIGDVISEAGAGGSGALLAKGFGGLPPPGDAVTMRVPNSKVGLIIGRAGDTIKNLQSRSGARIQVQNDREMEPGATERTVTLIGNKRATDMATEMILEVIDENRPRGPSIYSTPQSNSYGQAPPYRPPQQWNPPAAPQGPGYQGGYQHPQAAYQQPPPAAYPPPAAQQPPYYAAGGYPPQTQYQGGGWDQSGAPPPAAQQPPAAQYDYYGQPVAAPAAAAAPVADAQYGGYAQPQQQQPYYGGYQQPAAAAAYPQQGYPQQPAPAAAPYGQQPAYAGQQAQPQQAGAYNAYSYPPQAAAGTDPNAYAAAPQQQQQYQGYAQQGYAPPAADGAAAGYDYNAAQAGGAGAPAPTAQ
eukprot:TRINITY_DN443_c0_g1_i1.p1 TRINITY_DN443_c0_g1~~TRINITY_DN443_c0_g1_i1.p1  ORF type:complete len:587 (+),score=155.31 TRINITY_DN443_c0_g1_i1:135-1895(+)